MGKDPHAIMKICPDSYHHPKYEENYPISLLKGVIHSSGQNKGMVLKTILSLYPHLNKIKTIIFIDDNETNLKCMEEAFLSSGIKVETFLFCSDTKDRDSRE